MAFPTYNNQSIIPFSFCSYPIYSLNNVDNHSNSVPYTLQNNNINVDNNTTHYMSANEDKFHNHYLFNNNNNTIYLPTNNLDVLIDEFNIPSPILPSFQFNSSSSSSESKKIKRNKINNNNRVGICEHPKHIYYRKYNSNISHILSISPLSSSLLPLISSPSMYSPTTIASQEMIKAVTQSIPRRGRPPKGFKSNGVPMDSQYCHITMTIRSLPKRLEPVVGKKNIFVCLTCLKKTDTDLDYLINPLYIGPQTTKKKKEKQ
ncbi:hypothetical protein BJ944DRAFT_246228 [Cunninghamella echinulata]|nr:hypothetical protein BJ944DRAFT_246228 [Cunninghamella echinulata]